MGEYSIFKQVAEVSLEIAFRAKKMPWTSRHLPEIPTPDAHHKGTEKP